jgi:hypothetical protein
MQRKPQSDKHRGEYELAKAACHGADEGSVPHCRLTCNLSGVPARRSTALRGQALSNEGLLSAVAVESALSAELRLAAAMWGSIEYYSSF